MQTLTALDNENGESYLALEEVASIGAPVALVTRGGHKHPESRMILLRANSIRVYALNTEKNRIALAPILPPGDPWKSAPAPAAKKTRAKKAPVVQESDDAAE